MGEALISGGGGGFDAKIYRWKRYNLLSETRYKWEQWELQTDVEYKWNKYNCSIQYTWDRWSTTVEYTWERWNYTTKTNWLNSTYTGYSHNFMGNYTGFSAPYVGTNGWWCARAMSGVRSPQQSSTSSSTISGAWYKATNYRNGSVTMQSESRGTLSGEWSFPFFRPTSMTSSSGYNNETWTGTIYDSSANGTTTTPTSKVDTVTSTNGSLYPNPGVSGSWWYQNRTSATLKGTSQSGTVTAVDNSTAYPNPGASGSYWYENRTQDYIRGSTNYGEVTTMNNPGPYPANGRWDVDGYWYVSAGSTTIYSKGSTLVDTVESTEPSDYPDVGYQSGYWYENRSSYIYYSIGTYKDHVYSTARSTYPDNDHKGEYWYVFEGEVI